MKKTAKQVMALVIVMTMVFSLGAFAFAAEFTDMPSEEHWAYNALNAAVSNGLLKGDNNKLYPSSNLSRAEMATMLNRAFGATQTADISKFSDVPKSEWYYIDIAKAVKMGTFSGDGASMRPSASISRQEAFVALARALQLKTDDVTVLNKFSDKELIADWAKPAMAAMTAAGYVNGDNGGANPTRTITRQEFAQVMYKAIKTYVNKAETISSVAEGNVMVNVPGAALKNLTVKGDLIIGDGVGAGDFTLDNVKVEGRVVVRGGGENSIKIINGSSVGSIVVSKTSDGGVRVVADASSSVQVVVVADGNDSVIVEGKVDTLTIEGKADVEIKGEIKNVEVKADAQGAKVEVAKGAKVDKLDSKASDVQVSGEGKITEAAVSGNNTKIDVPETKVTVDKGVEGTIVGDKPVSGGSEVVAEPSTPPTPPTPPAGGGGGGGTTPIDYKANIDKIITDAFAMIVSSLNNEPKFLLNGNNVSITYPSSYTSTYATVGDVLTKIQNSNLSQGASLITAAESNIKTVTAGGKTLDIQNNFSLSAIKQFVYGMEYAAGKTIAKDTLTSALPNTYSVVVVDMDNKSYTYTITKAVQ